MARGEFELAREGMRQVLSELEALPDGAEHSLRRLRVRLSNIEDILGYRLQN